MKDGGVKALISETIIGLRYPDQHVCLPNEAQMKELIRLSKTELQKEPFCLMLKGKIVIAGDLHGDVRSLLRIFNTLGYPPSTRYLFLGDYVDRGPNSIEVMIILLSLKVLFTDSIYLIRGNHECRKMTQLHGFYSECLTKMNERIYESFIDLFDELPIIALIDGSIFCCHGGISHHTNDLTDLLCLKKPTKNDKFVKKQTINDLLWSDPSHEIDLFKPSDREDALDEFLEENALSCIIRGHQFCQNGFDQPFENNKCWTVFSSADYCQLWNKAAVLVVDNSFVSEVFVFEPLVEVEKSHQKLFLPDWIMLNQNPQIEETFMIDFDLFDQNENLFTENSLLESQK